MKKLFLLIVAALFLCSTASAQNIRRIATWNMKWLGGVTGYRDFILYCLEKGDEHRRAAQLREEELAVPIQ